MCICPIAQLCLTLCDPMDSNPPGSSVHGILQARILEWVAMPSSRGFSNPGIEPASLACPALAGGFFTTVSPGKPQKTKVKSKISKPLPSLPVPGEPSFMVGTLSTSQEGPSRLAWGGNKEKGYTHGWEKVT